MLKKVPLPICGVALGVAALGNLLQSYSEEVRYACGIVSALLLLLFLVRCAVYPKTLAEDLKNPIMASVFGTFSMTLMLLSAYLAPLAKNPAMMLWFLAIGLHGILIIGFTARFMLRAQLEKVFASYYIVYVGIAVAGVSAPAFGQQNIGSATFWFGGVCFLILTVLITTRYVKCREVPPPARPLICIYAAPASLCVAAYVQSVTPKSIELLLGMYGIAALLFLFGLIKAVQYLKSPFYPSYAAFTFPFVISAIASKQTVSCAANLGVALPWMQSVITVQTVVAVLFVVYTLVRFLAFLIAPARSNEKQPIKGEAVR